MKKVHAHAHGIGLKKYHGQNFLRERWVVDQMLDHVALTDQTTVVEIGPGDGFLTTAILEKTIKHLYAYEIDPEWATYLTTTIQDLRFSVTLDNVLDADLSSLEKQAPWVILSNLPYHVTWPILRLFHKHRLSIAEGVVMVQEEVAQRIVATYGRSLGYPSLFFQHYFTWTLLAKIPPEAFHPAPKVFSRLVHFAPRTTVEFIEREDEFWQFIKLCFNQPRRTLKNNLQQTHFNLDLVSPDLLALRAQQMTKEQFLSVWHILVRQKP